jgi:hypothetical protein
MPYIYFTISHSKSILLISSNKIAPSMFYMKRFSKYISFKTEILLIPLLQAISHIFEISEDDHAPTQDRWSRARHQ